MFAEFYVLGQLETLEKVHAYIQENDYTDGNDEITDEGDLYFSFDCRSFPSVMYDEIAAEFSDAEILFSIMDEDEFIWISNDMDKKRFKAFGRVIWEDDDSFCMSEEEMNKCLCNLADVPYTEDVDIESVRESENMENVLTMYCERVSRDEVEDYF